MKQVTQTQRGGNIEVLDVPPPALRPDGVLVQTSWSLISAGTERAKVELARASLIAKARARPDQLRQVLATLQQEGPTATYRKVTNRLSALEPLGYSCSGIVLQVGDRVSGLRAGDRVACAGSGYANHAEINFVPQNLCARVPDGGQRSVGLDEAAFATLGAIALQGVRQADVRIGEVVAVIGLGLVGLLAVQILRAGGCVVLGIDLNAERRRLAGELGCSATATGEDEALAIAGRLAAGRGVDSVLLTAATPSDEPVIMAGHLCRDRGRVVVIGDVGLGVPRTLYYEKELELRLSRSYGPGRYDPSYEERGQDYPIGYVRWTEQRNLEAFLALLADGRVNVRPLITHRFPLTAATDAYTLITAGSEPFLAVMLEYPPSSPGPPSATDVRATAPGIMLTPDEPVADGETNGAAPTGPPMADRATPTAQRVWIGG